MGSYGSSGMVPCGSSPIAGCEPSMPCGCIGALRPLFFFFFFLPCFFACFLPLCFFALCFLAVAQPLLACRFFFFFLAECARWPRGLRCLLLWAVLHFFLAAAAGSSYQGISASSQWCAADWSSCPVRLW